MALHLYKGGTEGLADGVQLSAGDMTEPLIFSGYDINTGDISYAQYAKLYLRADEGEEWVGVCLKIADVSGSEDLHDILIVGRNSYDEDGLGQINKNITTNTTAIAFEDYTATVHVQSAYTLQNGMIINSYTDGAYTLFFPYVNDVNSENCAIYLSPLLYIGLKDPQTSIKFIMMAGVKYE